MKFKKTLVFACAIAIPFAANAAFKDVTVNGTKITAAEQEQILAAATAHGQKRTPQLEQAIRDNLIARTVVLQEAEKAGVEKRPAVAAAIQNARKQIVSDVYLSDYLKKNPVTDAEVRKVYDQQKAQYGKTEIHINHIAVKTQDEAQKIQARLAKGESFQKIARAESLDPTAKRNGGDMGWLEDATTPDELKNAGLKEKGRVNTGALPPPMVSTLQGLKGNKTAIVTGPAGYEVVMNRGTRNAKAAPSFDRVKPEIRRALEAQKVNAYMRDLVKKAQVK